MTKRILPMVRTALLVALVTVYPGVEVNAGNKIYQSVDGNGVITFTDVPLLLEPHTAQRANAARKSPQLRETAESQEKPCRLDKSAPQPRCRSKRD